MDDVLGLHKKPHQQNNWLLWHCDGRLKFPLTACHAVALLVLLDVWDTGLLWDRAAWKLPTHENSDLVNFSHHPPPSSSLCPFFRSLLCIPHISMPSLTRSLKGPSMLVRRASSKYHQVLSPCSPSHWGQGDTYPAGPWRVHCEF